MRFLLRIRWPPGFGIGVPMLFCLNQSLIAAELAKHGPLQLAIDNRLQALDAGIGWDQNASPLQGFSAEQARLTHKAWAVRIAHRVF